jgi:gliding motility-associated-like protein
MIVLVQRFFLLFWIFYFPFQSVFSQQSSKDNYTGAWETPASWSPTWTVPQTTNLSGYDITINGYITINGSLSFSGTGSNLIINDTLVIKGNLLLENNTQVTINDNGILIVRGNLTISNQSIIMANGYLIVTGDIIKNSSLLQGPFTSNDNPVKVFIGGTISPVELTDNYLNFPVLNCTTPTTTTYTNSTCSYGNMTDMISDPINSFFQYTCTVSNVNSNIPVCAANTINLTSSGGTSYSWSGPDGFTSSAQNPSISNADIAMAGAYMITVIAAPGCTDTDTINVTVNALPIATAGSNSPVCVGNTINLTSSGGISYSWGGPKGFTSSAQNPSIPNANTSMAGTYTVTVTAATGCKVTKTTNVIVNSLPIAIAGSNSPVCEGNIINLTSSGGTGYSWSGPNGFTSSVQNPSIPNANTAKAGAYTVTVTAATGCTATNTTSVIVNALPIATAGSNSPVCEGNTINLTSSGGTGYSWTGPNGFTSSAQNPSIPNANTSMAGAYKVTATAATGCTATNKTNVIVNALPIATISSNSPVCAGNTINLTSSGGTGYSWSGPNGFINSAQNPSIPIANPAMSGAYKVTITAATGCTNTNTTSIIVNALPTASITITDNSEIENNDGIICNGATATLTASGGTSYIWSSGETTSAITKGTAGTYTVTVINANGCTNTATATVVVNALPVVKASNNGPVFSFMALNLIGGPEGMTTYSWTGPNGFTSNSQSPTVSTSALEVMAGVYTLTVTNASGCSNTATTPVEINELPIPSVITPNNDRTNDYFVIGEIIGKVELIIFNRWGNIEYTNSNYLNDWDGRNNKGVELPNDTYFYILKFESGIIKKGSVLIKR